MASGSQKLSNSPIPKELDIKETVGLASLQFLNEQELSSVQFNDVSLLKLETSSDSPKIEIGHSETTFVCYLCKRTKSNKPSMRKHIHQSHLVKNIVKKFCCSYCEYKTAKRSVLKGHLRIHTGEKPFQCKLCDYKANYNTSLQWHLRKHTSLPLLPCKLCKFKTWCEEKLRLHIEQHDLGIVKNSGQHAFSCKMCDYTTRYKRCLDSHTSNKHGDGLNCPYCNYKAKRSHVLKIHLRVHTNEKPFTCKFCSYSARQHAHINRHITRVHFGVKPYVCYICDYKGGERRTFKTHMLVHTGEKPYACKLCDYRGTQLGNLKTHMSSHSVERHFACTVCNKQLKTKEILKTHMRIHTDVKPYICNVCGHGTTQHTALRVHMTTHSAEARFKCLKCEFACRVKETLVKHMYSYHMV